MNLNTSLVEVAHTLPTQTAERLLILPNHRAIGVLGCIRLMVTQWEEQGVTLDPISFSVVVDSAVCILLELEQLLWEKR